MKNSKRCGFTFIEIIVFIVLIGILATGVLAAFNTVFKGIGYINPQAMAIGYSSKCLEWLEGQRYLNGYSSINCCVVADGLTGYVNRSIPVPSFCNVALGNTNIQTYCTAVCNDPTLDEYKTITSTAVTNGISVSLSTMIANY